MPRLRAVQGILWAIKWLVGPADNTMKQLNKHTQESACVAQNEWPEAVKPGPMPWHPAISVRKQPKRKSLGEDSGPNIGCKPQKQSRPKLHHTHTQASCPTHHCQAVRNCWPSDSIWNIYQRSTPMPAPSRQSPADENTTSLTVKVALRVESTSYTTKKGAQTAKALRPIMPLRYLPG